MVDVTQGSAQGVSLRAFNEAQVQASGLGEGDPRLSWVGQAPLQIAPPGTATMAMARAVHGALRDSAQIHGSGDGRLRLVDMPLNVFSALRNDPEALSAVLESRNETINSVLKTWAESIKHNAEEDQKAHERRLQQGEMRSETSEPNRADHASRLFVGALDNLVRSGVVTRAAAADFVEEAGIERDKTFFGPGLAAESSAKAIRPTPSDPLAGAFKR